MRPRGIGSFPGDQSGAISPLYAIVLLVLIALAGVGFDYGRLMAMQSELQNAADQAALAAATQLDGRTGAMERARSAASEAFTNETRVSNDGEGRGITDFTVTFYVYDPGEEDGIGAEIPAGGDDADAAIVRVSVNGRGIFYALTPVVGAISREGVTAHAMAMLKQAACNVPPLMVCVGHLDFQVPVTKGMGLRLRGDSLAPGNYMFLDVYGGFANDELGLNKTYEGCSALENINVKTGKRGSQTDPLATRFDYFNSYNKIPCNSDGDLCPSQGVRKELVVREEITVELSDDQQLTPGSVGYPACGAAGVERDADWVAPADVKDAIAVNSVLGHKVGNFRNDDCFDLPIGSPGRCEYLGDGNWGRAQYMDANPVPGGYPTEAQDWSRYDFYRWEIAEPETRMKPKLVSYILHSPTEKGGKNKKWSQKIENYCAYSHPIFAEPYVSQDPTRDRRVLRVAVVDNCDRLEEDAHDNSLRGHSVKPNIVSWMDIFLLEPPVHSSQAFEAEVIGPALRPGGFNSFQYYSKGRAVLIR